jgi:flagella basal body P-ring formation protein FlgA
MSRAVAIVILVFAANASAATVTEKAAQARVEASLPADLAVVKLELPRALARATGDVSVTWPSPPRLGWVSIQILVGSRKGYARVQLQKVRQVVVARRPLLKGGRIGAADLAVEPRGVAEGDGLETPPSALVGSEITRDVPAGELVRDADVARPAPLARGARVTVLVRRGNVTVSTSGQLERAARPGDETQVRLLAASRLLSGRLLDGATVLVEGDLR